MNKLNHFLITINTLLLTCTLYAAQMKTPDPDKTIKDEFLLIDKVSTNQSQNKPFQEKDTKKVTLEELIINQAEEIKKLKREINALKLACIPPRIRQVTTIKSCGYYMQNVIFSPNGKLLVASDDSKIYTYDTTTYKKINTLQVGKKSCLLSTEYPVKLSFSPESRYLACTTQYENLFIYDLNDHYKVVWKKAEVTGGIAFSNKGNHLATASQNKAYIYNWTTRKQVTTLQGDSHIYQLAFSPDTQLLALVYSYKVSIYNTSAYKQLKSFTSDSYIYNFTFFNDSKRLAMTDMYDIYIYDTITYEHLAILTGENAITSLASSFNDQYLASISSGFIGIYSPTSYKLLTTTKAHTNEGYLSFSPDKQYLASAGWDNSIKIWKIVQQIS